MSNYNFFEPYIKKPEKFNYERVLWMTAIAVALFLMGLVFLTNTLKLNALDSQAENLDVQINTPKLQKGVNEVQDVENTMHQIENSAKRLEFLEVSTAASQSFTYGIFSKLNVMVPENVFVSSVGYANRVLTLRGYSESVEGIALFSHQLSSAPEFDMVTVSNVISDNDNYSFEMSAFTPNTNFDMQVDTADMENPSMQNMTDEEEKNAESEGE